jgi:hypothetical protein
MKLLFELVNNTTETCTTDLTDPDMLKTYIKQCCQFGCWMDSGRFVSGTGIMAVSMEKV